MSDRGTTIARVYAVTLLRLAEKHDALEAVSEDLAAISDLLDTNAGLRRFLTAPQIAAGEKRAFIERVFGDQLHPVVIRFLGLVIDKHREPLLPVIGRVWKSILDERANRQAATVIGAAPFDDATLVRIRSALEQVTGKTIELDQEVDEEILGGVMVRTGDTVIDGSLRSRLATLRRRLRSATP